MFGGVNRSVLAMGLLRILSGLLEIAGALLCMRYNRVSVSLRVNSLLGLAGPLFFLAVGAIGLVSVSSSLRPVKMLLLALGILLVLWGTTGT